jgi:hypothetical protein
MFTIDPGDYEAYDMSAPVLTSPIEPGEWCRKLWTLHYDPIFMLRCVGSLRSVDDLGLVATGVGSLLGHTEDFET